MSMSCQVATIHQPKATKHKLSGLRISASKNYPFIVMDLDLIGFIGIQLDGRSMGTRLALDAHSAKKTDEL